MVLHSDIPSNMAIPTKLDGTTPKAAPAEELWRHSDPKSTPMWRFIQHVNEKYGLKLDDYPGLYKWSIENVGPFWEEVWQFTGIKASKPYDEVRMRCYTMGGEILLRNLE